MDTLTTKKTVRDYTQAELETFQKQFLPIAERYKARYQVMTKIIYISSGYLISVMVLRMVLRDSKLIFVGIPAAIVAWITHIHEY